VRGQGYTVPAEAAEAPTEAVVDLAVPEGLAPIPTRISTVGLISELL
jgi:hypothetical protein